MTPLEELKRISELKILNGGEWDKVHAALPDLVRAVEAAQELTQSPEAPICVGLGIQRRWREQYEALAPFAPDGKP